MSFNEPTHLPPAQRNHECHDLQPGTFRCCACKQQCAVVENASWPALNESACCRSAFYRVDSMAMCMVCENSFDAEAEGRVDDEGQATCGICLHDERQQRLGHYRGVLAEARAEATGGVR